MYFTETIFGNLYIGFMFSMARHIYPVGILVIPVQQQVKWGKLYDILSVMPRGFCVYLMAGRDGFKKILVGIHVTAHQSMR